MTCSWCEILLTTQSTNTQQKFFIKPITRQVDLELAAAALARSSADLGHALTSNKKLLAWKVG